MEENPSPPSDTIEWLLSKPLLEEARRLGWTSFTEVQRLAIPPILDGKNVLMIAPTGTGKTEAAIFPIFELLLQRMSETKVRGISILYITPLRALNRDVLRRLTEVGKRIGIEVQVRHGDTPTSARRAQALKPPDMLITTPETLQAIIPGRSMRRHLQSVRWVVIDEIHEMATDERGTQLSVGLERLRQLTSVDFQRVGLSATIGYPELIAKFMAGPERETVVVKAVEAKSLEVSVESPTPSANDEKEASEVGIPAGSIRRIRRLFELVQEHRSTLIFTNTREHAEALASRMLALKPGIRIGVHHGSLSREVRMETEGELKSGRLNAVVCTSSLELGIDVGFIDFVVQYMSPRQVTRLVQRVGRSGHLVGATARGCVMGSWPDDILESAVISKLALEGRLELPVIHENALDVLAHQIAGLVLDYGQIGMVDVYQIIRRAWPFRNLTRDEILAVANQLHRQRVIWISGENLRKRGPNTFHYYYTNLSMIPDVRRYDVYDFIRRRKIGSLDQEFVARNGRAGVEFIMHGQTWKILGVDEEENLVQVEPVSQSFAAIPSWEGEIIPVPLEVAREVGRLREEISGSMARNADPSKTLDGYPLSEEAVWKVVNFVQRQMDEGFLVPTHSRVLIEAFENYAVIHTCFGDVINQTLSRILAAILSSKFGVNVATQSDSYRIALIAPIHLYPEELSRELLKLRAEDADSILAAVLGDTNLFAWRLWHVARRFGAVERNAEYKSAWGRTLAVSLRDTPVYRETFRELGVEKLDVEGTKQVLSDIENKKIEVAVSPKLGSYSPFALAILDKIVPQDILRPAVPTMALVETIKGRLESEQTRLVCMFKGDWEGLRTVRNIADNIRCPKCHSTLIAATYPSDTELIKVARKKMAGRKLTNDEEKVWLDGWKNAGIVQTHGRKAILTLAARGVGPTTAVRLLRRLHRSDREFILDILKAERDYVRTRAFWD